MFKWLIVVIPEYTHPQAAGQSEVASVQQLTFEIVPHPRSRGDWQLKPRRGAPFGLWYRDRDQAVSYAEWVAREVDRAEIRVFNRDGILTERRVVGGPVHEGE